MKKKKRDMTKEETEDRKTLGTREVNERKL